MALSLIRHNIQVKEKTFVFFKPECCSIKAYHSHECDCDNCDIIPGTEDWTDVISGNATYSHANGYMTKRVEWTTKGMPDSGCTYRPFRCSSCNTELKAWQRKKMYTNKWTKLFNKNYLRWRFVKMLTLTMPAHLHIKIRKEEDPEDYMIYLRNEIRRRFKLMRKRSKYWNSVVDGGQWFYECTLKDGKTNPHLHILLVGPKLINQDKLQIELEKYNLGKIAKFSSPRNKDGVVQKMTYWRNRRLVSNKSAVSRALNYVMKYVMKEEQADGKNNSFFGDLHKKKKK